MPREELENLPRTITKAQVLSHILSPEHTRNVPMETVDEAQEKRYPILQVPKTYRVRPHLDLAAFGLAIYNALKDKVVGYMLQIRQHGKLVHVGSWNWAQTPADKNQGWNENTQMHVASVSKFLTAVGMVKCLHDHGISYDAKIIDYLPAYWKPGVNVNQVTFRNLLTQTSGFRSVPKSSASDYAFMKSVVEAGVCSIRWYDYENMNFGLCRILIPIIVGDIDRNMIFIPPHHDQVWDYATIEYYKKYMQSNVFGPAGVPSADFKARTSGFYQNALAYPWKMDGQNGWDSGDLKTMSGGAGWRLTIKELLNVMDHVRRKNTIIDKSKTQYMLDNYFGIDQIINSPAGKLYNKNGGWGGNRKEQCVAYFLPDDMELVLFVNSPIGQEDYSLRKLASDTFSASLVS